MRPCARRPADRLVRPARPPKTPPPRPFGPIQRLVRADQQLRWRGRITRAAVVGRNPHAGRQLQRSGRQFHRGLHRLQDLAGHELGLVGLVRALQNQHERIAAIWAMPRSSAARKSSAIWRSDSVARRAAWAREKFSINQAQLSTAAVGPLPSQRRTLRGQCRPCVAAVRAGVVARPSTRCKSEPGRVHQPGAAPGQCRLVDCTKLGQAARH